MEFSFCVPFFLERFRVDDRVITQGIEPSSLNEGFGKWRQRAVVVVGFVWRVQCRSERRQLMANLVNTPASKDTTQYLPMAHPLSRRLGQQITP
jgi:hypothetical protein